jgi:hypothetical protein
MIRKLCLIFILCVAACITVAAQNRSVYTSTKTCRTIESDPNEAGWYRGRCKGVGGYTLDLTEGDLRQSLVVRTAARKEFDLNFSMFFSSFSSVGEKVEWRMKNGVPIALIARFYVSDPENSEKTKSYLMVAKIGRKEACVVDVIGPGAKQNERARQAADAAAGKPCKATALD